MCVGVCVCICMCMCMYVCMYVYVYVCVCVYMCICTSKTKYDHSLRIIVLTVRKNLVNPQDHIFKEHQLNLKLIPNVVCISKRLSEVPFSLYLYKYWFQIFVHLVSIENGDIIHRKRSAKVIFLFLRGFIDIHRYHVYIRDLLSYIYIYIYSHKLTHTHIHTNNTNTNTHTRARTHSNEHSHSHIQ